MSDAHDPSPPRVRAVILDWAGTVIDHGSRAPVLAFVAGFAEQGVEITEAEARTPMGMSKRAHIEALCSMPSVIERWVAVHGEPPVPADIDRMYARFIPVLLALLPDHCAPIPGAFEAVQAMRARGLSIGSTTGYPRAAMDILAPLAAKAGYVPDCILTADDVPAGRPAPWAIFRACEAMGAYPMSQVVKVDDTVAGIRAARNAGCWAIGVAATGNRLGLTASALGHMKLEAREAQTAAAGEILRRAGAHLVVDSVADLPAVIEGLDSWLAAGARPG
ncbi:MAG: phosphonoacetaldehyde hydrolase [Myxococcales bacterium]|nr:phosphonoacetaldehyde hydrolase [Myxococcales bacterium]